MGADGESPRKLLQGAPGDRFLQVQWSPNGERIAYIKTHTEGDKSETAIETLLFYHPAVWWVSGHLRADVVAEDRHCGRIALRFV